MKYIINTPSRFIHELIKGPTWVFIWVNVLMAVNFAGLFFLNEPVAQVVVATFAVTALLMMVLYYHFGMSKILGLGHVLWLGLVPYLISIFASLTVNMQIFASIVITVNSISLLFDARDVVLYFKQKSRATTI